MPAASARAFSGRVGQPFGEARRPRVRQQNAVGDDEQGHPEGQPDQPRAERARVERRQRRQDEQQLQPGRDLADPDAADTGERDEKAEDEHGDDRDPGVDRGVGRDRHVDEPERQARQQRSRPDRRRARRLREEREREDREDRIQGHRRVAEAVPASVERADRGQRDPDPAPPGGRGHPLQDELPGGTPRPDPAARLQPDVGQRRRRQPLVGRVLVDLAEPRRRRPRSTAPAPARPRRGCGPRSSTT